MFIGKAEHTIHQSGRLSIPSKMRDVINDKYDPADLFLFLLPGNTICLYPGEEFEKFITKLDNPEGSTLEDMLEYERMCAEAEPCKLDSSGRIIIPPKMRKDAQIDQDVLIVGARYHIEIWNRQLWEYSRTQRRSGLERYRTYSAQPSASLQNA